MTIRIQPQHAKDFNINIKYGGFTISRDSVALPQVCPNVHKYIVRRGKGSAITYEYITKAGYFQPRPRVRVPRCLPQSHMTIGEGSRHYEGMVVSLETALTALYYIFISRRSSHSVDNSPHIENLNATAESSGNVRLS